MRANSSSATSKHALSKYGTDFSRQSFLYGKLSTQCFMGVCPSSALKEAANISGRDKVTSQQLLAIEALVEELDSKSSLIDTLSGVMSFINVVW